MRTFTALMLFLFIDAIEQTAIAEPDPAIHTTTLTDTVTYKVRLEPMPGKKIGWLGVSPVNIGGFGDALDLPAGRSTVVVGVGSDWPAGRAGIQSGDIILSVGGVDVGDVRSMRREVIRRSGTEVDIVLRRPRGGLIGLIANLRAQADAGNMDAAALLYGLYRMRAAHPAEAHYYLGWYRGVATSGKPGIMLSLLPEFMRLATDDRAELVEIARRFADRGDKDAMYALAIAYENGFGVDKSAAEALNWYRRAAEKGHPAAMRDVGSAYEAGAVVKESRAEAIRWYRRAADAGDVTAMVNMIGMSSRDLPETRAEWLHYLNRAAEAGDLDSMRKLALLLDRSETDNDPAKAAKLMCELLGRADRAAINLLTSKLTGWSLGFRTAFQRCLAEAGVFNGPIDGNFDAATLDVIAAYSELLPAFR